MRGLYIYGIRGRSDTALKAKGIEQKEVYTIPYKNAEVVISNVNVDDFKSEVINEKLKDLKWAESQVRAHAAVLEECMQTSSVVPWKFGTVFKTRKGLQEFLRENHEKFANIFRKFSGKQEWGIKVYIDIRVLRKKIRKANDKAKDLERTMKTKPEGAAFFLRKKLEDMMSEEADKVINQTTRKILKTLGKQAEEKIENKLLDKKLTGKEADMVLNAAFLIKKVQFDNFIQAFKKLEQEFSPEGFEFNLSGPWPPYNFVEF